jgi:hypothetical protein
MRCQHYGHTRKYCNRPFNCVKCGGPHNSETCPKPRESPAKCALYGGPHPANYKGCEQYRHILSGYNPHRLTSMERPPPPTQEDSPPNLPLARNNPTRHTKQNVAMQKRSAETTNPQTTLSSSLPFSLLNSELSSLNWSTKMGLKAECYVCVTQPL